jgi:hypothetical protein
VQQARVREFRDSRRLGDDADFAFTYEEAKLAGGDFVAQSWARVRALEEEKLVPAAAAALEPRSSTAPLPFRGPSSKADLPMTKRSSVRLRPAGDQAEQINNRVSGLTQVFMDAGVMKPSGHISEGIFNEWKTGVTRLSQEKVTHADKATIINTVRTYAELKHFMAARDRAMPPEELDLRSFLDTGTEGPVRAQGLEMAVQAWSAGVAAGRDPACSNSRYQEAATVPGSGH